MSHAIHPCPLCGRRLKGERGLARHMDDMHPKLAAPMHDVIPTQAGIYAADFDTVIAAEGVAPGAEAAP
jgi:hypothetical protein